MSNSFYVEKILNKNNPNEGLIIDFKYPSGALYRGPPNRDLQARPKLCFSEHPLCRRIGVPGYYNSRYLFYNDLPSRLANWNVPPVIDLANPSHVNPNLAEWIVPPAMDLTNSRHVNHNITDLIVPPVIDLTNSRHVNHNITELIVPPIIDLANSAPVDSRLASNIRPHLSENPFQSTSSSVQKQGTFPKWHHTSRPYPEQIQNKSSAFSEPTKNNSENGTIRDNKSLRESQSNSSLITSNVDFNTSKKSSEKSIQCNEDFSDSEKRGSLIISNADSSTSKKSPERSINYLKTHPVQVINSSNTLPVQLINSSKTLPVQVTNSSKALPNQEINSSERLGQVRAEQVESFSNISPEQLQDISITNPIAKKDIFSRWRKHIIDNHAELATNNSRIFPETFQNIPRIDSVQVQNAFPGWYCRLSTSLEETDVKEEFPPESDGKPKRKRTTFSSAQLVHLENNYIYENRYLTRLKRIQLAAELGLSEKQVKVWFQNRRVRDKPKDETKPSMRGKRVKYEDIQVKNEMTNTPCNDNRGSTPPRENLTISNKC